MNESAFDKSTSKTGNLFDLEVHFAGNHGEKSVVACASYSVARMEPGTTLTKDNIASFCSLITENFDSKTF